MPVLDATFLIDLQRDPEGKRDLLEDLIALGEPLAVPAQVAIEFAAGDQDPAAALRELKESFTLIEMDEALVLEAAQIAAEAMERGRFPGWADIQIAATARRLGMPLVTRNVKHYEPLRIQILEYEA